MTVSLSYDMNLTLTDSANANALSSAPAIAGTALNESATLNSGTTPAVTMVAAGTVTLSTGTATLDLTSLTGLDGSARSGSGLKVVTWKFRNNSTHSVTVAKGASSGFTGFGASFSLLIPAGATRQGQESTNGTAVSGSVKTLDFSGTGTDTLQYEFGMG